MSNKICFAYNFCKFCCLLTVYKYIFLPIEPLRDVEATSSTVIAEGVRALTSPLHIDSSSEQHSNNLEESLPSRKRRRNPVDYRELYEQMKKEGNLA